MKIPPRLSIDRRGFALKRKSNQKSESKKFEKLDA